LDFINTILEPRAIQLVNPLLTNRISNASALYQIEDIEWVVCSFTTDGGPTSTPSGDGNSASTDQQVEVTYSSTIKEEETTSTTTTTTAPASDTAKPSAATTTTTTSDAAEETTTATISSSNDCSNGTASPVVSSRKHLKHSKTRARLFNLKLDDGEDDESSEPLLMRSKSWMPKK